MKKKLDLDMCSSKKHGTKGGSLYSAVNGAGLLMMMMNDELKWAMFYFKNKVNNTSTI